MRKVVSISDFKTRSAMKEMGMVTRFQPGDVVTHNVYGIAGVVVVPWITPLVRVCRDGMRYYTNVYNVKCKLPVPPCLKGKPHYEMSDGEHFMYAVSEKNLVK